ncbi:hypothetical protein GCM10010266_69290 [Streptomyces griseomycini]|uniref:hypothetical protein n=1 Tax=Streptomyces griseomycini TaxID=66895 RepID=UPI001874C664|nr:hypothetical protein [Streptomyces griseomycini]GGQ36098.1 hypothetical protein GCM10010266_69290 [Streptomyces griseomycini]
MPQILNVAFSRCTVPSQLMRIPLPAPRRPRALGVDGFALCGDIYGALLADAATRPLFTPWEGWDAEQLSRWLCEHPGVGLVCRDGSLAHRQGITDGVPVAVQVSDRFHQG